MLDALRLSVGTLTIVPSGAIVEIDRHTAARAMIIAPLAVLPLAAAVALVGWLGRTAGLPPLAVGLLVVGGLALGSRALHLDGLADTVDGFGSGWSAERSLMVMRRGDVGPMGVVALIVVLGLQAVSIGRADPGCDRRPAGRRGGLLLPGGAVSDLPTRRTGCPRGRAWRRGRRLGAAFGCRRLLARVLLIMAWTAWLVGHSPASGVLATVAAALAVGGSGLSLRTPAGWRHRRRDGRRDRNRVHRHDHCDDHMNVTSAGLAPQRP